jgi:hypothetical protein
MTLIDFPSKPELQKRLDEVASGWPIQASPDLGKPFGDINGPEECQKYYNTPRVHPVAKLMNEPHPGFSNPPEEEVNDLARWKEHTSPPSPAANICEEAAALLDGDRAKQHGDKITLHQTMAGLFSAYLGMPIKASQAAMLEVLMKTARTKHGELNADDFRDGSAYFGIAWECADAGC